MPEKQSPDHSDDTKGGKYEVDKRLLGQRGESVTPPVFARGQRGKTVIQYPVYGPEGREGIEGDKAVSIYEAQSPFGYEHIRMTHIPEDKPKASIGRIILEFFFGPQTP